MENKKILIISHTFPPNLGIGGRRWAKFTKYLNRQGDDIFVLKEQSKLSKNQSPWTEDIKDLNPKQIYIYSTFFPKILQKKNLNIWDKICYKITHLILGLLCSGNPLDKTILIKKRFIKQLDKIVKENKIKNLIVTGAPFNLLYYCTLYKEKNPNINLICDFRDPWTWGQNYGINALSEKKAINERRKEKLVITKSNFIFVPTEIMMFNLIDLYNIDISKIRVISHGFDPEEIIIKSLKQNINKDFIDIAIIGQLYNDQDFIYDEISKGLNDIRSPFRIHVFSNSKKYSNYFSDKNLFSFKVFYNELLPSKLLFKKLVSFDFVLLIQPDFAKDFISTKLYELAYSKIPILFIGSKGIASDFIINNKLGIFIEKDKIKDFFSSGLLISNYSHDPTIELDEYSLERIALKIIKTTI